MLASNVLYILVDTIIETDFNTYRFIFRNRYYLVIDNKSWEHNTSPFHLLQNTNFLLDFYICTYIFHRYALFVYLSVSLSLYLLVPLDIFIFTIIGHRYRYIQRYIFGCR